jgi:hypothetical protein
MRDQDFSWAPQGLGFTYGAPLWADVVVLG